MPSDRGFTLLEVLVAFLVLSLILTAAYQSIGSSTRAVEHGERRLAALTIAEGVMARLGADLSLAPGEQVVSEGPWTATIKTEHATADRQTWRSLGRAPMAVRLEIRHEASGLELTQFAVMLGAAP